MYEEWWLGPLSGDPTDLAGWRRPYFDDRAFPHDVWAMEQPVPFNGSLVWLDNGAVWGVPQHRLAGLSCASNGEFSTATFGFPAAKAAKAAAAGGQGGGLWLEADALWGEKPGVGPEWRAGGCNGVGGSDEGHAAYVQVELRDGATRQVIPGYEKDGCILMNKAGRLPLAWTNATQPIAAGAAVYARVYFRDATVYALGSA